MNWRAIFVELKAGEHFDHRETEDEDEKDGVERCQLLHSPEDGEFVETEGQHEKTKEKSTEEREKPEVERGHSNVVGGDLNRMEVIHVCIAVFTEVVCKSIYVAELV